MNLWHYKLIPHLPCIKTTGDKHKNQLCGLHRECCALRGKGWGKKHSTVDYVFKHNYLMLYNYHLLVIGELEKRGFNIGLDWKLPYYRGKRIGHPNNCFDIPNWFLWVFFTYPEHNDKYLQECLENLKNKGIVIDASRLY